MGIKRYPYYFKDFKCIGGACDDSCCIGWEVDIDDDALAVYNGVTGGFGERLRASMTCADGSSFVLKNNRCPFLNNENLCDIYISLGHDKLCTVCREYPRFTENAGGLTEVGLGLSCPTAAELILKSSEKTYFIEEAFNGADDDEEFLETVLKIRADIMDILQNRDEPVKVRAARMTAYAEAAQKRINDNLSCDGIEAEIPNTVSHAEDIKECVSLCRELTLLTDGWTEEISGALALFDGDYTELCREFDSFVSDREYEYEHILVYFIFRYLIKAVFDCDVLTRVRFAAVSYLIIRQLDMTRWLRQGKKFDFYDRVKTCALYSKEVEHCQDNIDFFAEEFIFRDIFKSGRLEGMLLL